jgi:osmotically-inducible protein OsmY
MKKLSNQKFLTAKAITLALWVGALPLVATMTGCAGDRYHQSTGEAIDDRGISMRVKSALANDAEYKYEGVDVKTFKGTVQLSGFVDTRAQKSRAEDLAKGVEGVKQVQNNISLK